MFVEALTATTTTTNDLMAAPTFLHTSYNYAAGTQHYEVDSADAVYEKIKSEVESAGLMLKRLVKLTNVMLADRFQYEADYLAKVRPPGRLSSKSNVSVINGSHQK